MNGHTLAAVLLALLLTLTASLGFAGILPLFPGTHSGIVAVSAATSHTATC